MRPYLFLTTAILFGLGAVSMTYAYTEAEDKSPPVEKLHKEKEGAKAPADLGAEEHQRTDSQSRGASKDVKGEVLRGKIVKIENEFYTVKDRGGHEVRLHVDKSTQMGNINLKDEFFKEGDRIEAYVTPTGHAHSISVLRPQPNSPNDPEGGG
jgi:hypothetical protein